ncbi:hypothetical protein C8R46DRAFT_1074599 [Mycena filopes]|nr:hypothetical protein C8R46DRAFT_1098552 [Mycena filopes]KAJ7179761.1 hypothetical protein C8R46DRAFT_1074599 [Mycena filopes]
MQLHLLALFSLAGVASASVVGRHAAPAQPSATSTWWHCPDKNTSSHHKITELCDSPPHQGALFGCTYATGTGTGTHSCVYDAKTGDCTSGGSRCPTKATTHTQAAHKRKDTTSF